MDPHAASGTGAPLTAPAVITLPAEIDIGNADQAGGQLHAALQRGMAVVIADMSATTFADSSAIRALLTAWDTAAARNIDLRMAIPAPAVLRILHVLGIASILRIYPSLSAALAPAPPLGIKGSLRGEKAPAGRPGRRQARPAAAARSPRAQGFPQAGDLFDPDFLAIRGPRFYGSPRPGPARSTEPAGDIRRAPAAPGAA